MKFKIFFHKLYLLCGKPKKYELISPKRDNESLVKLLFEFEKEIPTETGINIEWNNWKCIGFIDYCKKEKNLFLVGVTVIKPNSKLKEFYIKNLIESLNIDDSDMLRQVVFELGEFKVKKSIDKLFKLVKHKSTGVQEAAILSLAKIGGTKVISQCVEWFRKGCLLYTSPSPRD